MSYSDSVSEVTYCGLDGCGFSPHLAVGIFLPSTCTILHIPIQLVIL